MPDKSGRDRRASGNPLRSGADGCGSHRAAARQALAERAGGGEAGRGRKEHRHAAKVGYDDVGQAVAVQISRRHGKGIRSRGISGRRPESAAAVARQHRDPAAAGAASLQRRLHGRGGRRCAGVGKRSWLGCSTADPPATVRPSRGKQADAAPGRQSVHDVQRGRFPRPVRGQPPGRASRASSSCSPTSIPPPRYGRGWTAPGSRRCCSTCRRATGRPGSAGSPRCRDASSSSATGEAGARLCVDARRQDGACHGRNPARRHQPGDGGGGPMPRTSPGRPSTRMRRACCW